MKSQCNLPAAEQEKPAALVTPTPPTHAPQPWSKPTFTQLALREALAGPVSYDITGTDFALS